MELQEDLTRNNLKAWILSNHRNRPERGCGITKSFSAYRTPKALNARIESVLDVDCAIGSIERQWPGYLFKWKRAIPHLTWNTGEI